MAAVALPPDDLNARAYRVFRLDLQGGVVSAQIISAADDEHAKEIAQALPSRHGLELWEQARCLARFPERETDA